MNQFSSEFDDHVMKHHHYKDSSCLGFHRRMVIGTHFSDNDQVRKFASTRHNAFRVSNCNFIKIALIFWKSIPMYLDFVTRSRNLNIPTSMKCWDPWWTVCLLNVALKAGKGRKEQLLFVKGPCPKTKRVLEPWNGLNRLFFD